MGTDALELLLKAYDLISDLVDHEGAEGFSEHTRKNLDKWFERFEAWAETH